MYLSPAVSKFRNLVNCPFKGNLVNCPLKAVTHLTVGFVQILKLNTFYQIENKIFVLSPFPLSVRLSFSLLLCLSAVPSVSLPVFTSLFVFASVYFLEICPYFLSFPVSVRLSLSLSVCPFLPLSVFPLSVFPSVCLSLGLSFPLSVCLLKIILFLCVSEYHG